MFILTLEVYKVMLIKNMQLFLLDPFSEEVTETYASTILMA